MAQTDLIEPLKLRQQEYRLLSAKHHQQPLVVQGV